MIRKLPLCPEFDPARVIVVIVLERISGGSGLPGVIDGFNMLMTKAPDHFHMILKSDNPFYKYLPGISVIVGGMWIMNFSTWGFNQYIIQRAPAAKSVAEAQKGVELGGIDYSTGRGFNLAALAIVGTLVALYAVFW